MFLTAFLFLRAYWIVSAGPSGHLKQSIQKNSFQTTQNFDTLERFKIKEAVPQLPQLNFD